VKIDAKEVKAVMSLKDTSKPETKKTITIMGQKVYEWDESNKKWNPSITLEMKNNTIQKIPLAPPPAGKPTSEAPPPAPTPGAPVE
jgi:hypothetical protein